MTTSIAISNVHDNDVYGYPLIRIVGKVSHEEEHVTVVQNEKEQRKWRTKDGNFKVLVLLNEGENILKLYAEKSKEYVTVTCSYNPEIISLQCTPRKVKLLYYVASDSDGSFQAPPHVDNTLQSAKKRLAFSGLLMQTFCATDMQYNDYVHKTFDLEMKIDDNGVPEPVVHVLKSRFDTKTIHSWGDNWQDGGQVGWRTILQEITERGMYEDHVIYMAIIGATHYDGTRILAHTALGGNSLGVFGSACLHTFATSIDDVEHCWNDTTKIAQGCFDDSCYRGTNWANYATCLGASMHEVGHSFGLPHTESGIMARGFDNFNRFFMISEPDLKKACTIDNEGGAFWHPSSAEILDNSPYFGTALLSEHEYFVEPRRAKRLEQKDLVADAPYTLWIKTEGWFKKEGETKWSEYSGNGSVFCDSFELVYQEGETVVLYDPNRSMYIRLEPTLVKFSMNFEDWHQLDNGGWCKKYYD